MTPNCIVLAVVGMPGAGKSIIAEVAEKYGFSRVVMGDVVRREAKLRGLPATAENLGKIALELRKKFGDDIIARRTLSKIIYLLENDCKYILIDGLRSLIEYEYFKRVLEPLCRFLVLAVHASPKTRFERLKNRGREDDPKTWDEFKQRDLRELKMGIGSLIALADLMLINESSINEFKNLIRRELERILEHENKSSC